MCDAICLRRLNKNPYFLPLAVHLTLWAYGASDASPATNMTLPRAKVHQQGCALLFHMNWHHPRTRPPAMRPWPAAYRSDRWREGQAGWPRILQTCHVLLSPRDVQILDAHVECRCAVTRAHRSSLDRTHSHDSCLGHECTSAGVPFGAQRTQCADEQSRSGQPQAHARQRHPSFEASNQPMEASFVNASPCI